MTVILLIRFIHGLFTAFFLTCIGYVYYAALTGKRGRLLYGAVAALTVEGIIVMANGGDCPLGGIHRRHGDDRDFFELIMPKRLSKRAVPVLGTVTILGMVVALTRKPRASSLGGRV